MATSKRKITFYLDGEAQAIVEKIPSFYRSSTIRNVIKKAAAEGWFNTPPFNTLGLQAAPAAPQPKQDGAPPAPPLGNAEANHGEPVETPAVFEESPVGGEDIESLDEGNPPGFKETVEQSGGEFPEAPGATPLVETVEFAPVEEPPDTAPKEEPTKSEKPPQAHRSLQEAFLARVKV